MVDLKKIDVSAPFAPLEDSGRIIVGRSLSGHQRIGNEGLLFLGKACETDDHRGMDVMMDAHFPHIAFICGKRGSGKSYTLGILAEELATAGIDIGVVIVDPVGVFWSIKYPNRSKTERKMLKQWKMRADGIGNMKVMAPAGHFSSMRDTVDEPFSISVADMTAEDWCSVFDIDRFKAQGLLIGTALQKVEEGYRALSPKGRKVRIAGHERFGLEDIIQVIERDVDVLSKNRGFAPTTRRSVIARFEAAKDWGVFSEEGTSMEELSVAGQVTVIDVSHPKLGDNTRSLVVGILARKVLEARIQATRAEDAEIITKQVSYERSIPVTWLLIDEAHLLLPHKGETPASSSLIEYAKLGRKPGCALVLATQRPAATNDDVLSQVDLMIGHNLALEDDMSALRRRMPSKIPNQMEDSDFIRALPVGVGIMADQQTQNRAFAFQVRPRKSHHAGRQAAPTREIAEEDTVSKDEPEEPVEDPAVADITPDKITFYDDGEDGGGSHAGDIPLIRELPVPEDEPVGEEPVKEEASPAEAGSDLPRFTMDELLGRDTEQKEDGGEESEAPAGEDEPATVEEPSEEAVSEEEEPPPDLEGELEYEGDAVPAFTPEIDREEMEALAGSKAKGLMEKELVDGIELVGLPLMKVTFRYLKKTLLGRKLQMEQMLWDMMTGEVVQWGRGGLRRSEGLPLVMALSDDEFRLWIALQEPRAVDSIEKTLNMEMNVFERRVQRLLDEGLASREEDVYFQTMKVKYEQFVRSLPPTEQALVLEELFQPTIAKKDVIRLVDLLFKGEVLRMDEVLYPYYKVSYVSSRGGRTVYFDAVTGSIDKFLTKFLG